MNGGKKIRRMTAAMLGICLTAMLSGCAGGKNEEKPAAPTLPPANVSVQAPDGDRSVRGTREYSVYAFLPEENPSQLTVTNLELKEQSGLQETAEELVRTLLEVTSQGSDETPVLSLYQEQEPEISGGICTVNLAPSALKMENKERYWLSVALATTLCALDEINGVNVLIAGQSVALDTSGNLAMGTLTGHPGENLQGLWEHMDARKAPLGNDISQTALTTAATVYYPLADGRGIGCECQTLTFPGQTPDQLAETMITALNDTMKRRCGDEKLPALEKYMRSSPVVTPRNDGGRIVNVTFQENIQDLLDRWDTDLPCLAAAITCTMTTFIPGVTEVSIRIGDKPVTEMSNSRYSIGTVLGGLFHRSEAVIFLTGSVKAFFEKDGKLTVCEKSLEREQADNPRAILKALLEGPDRREKENGVLATLPDDVTDDDILGIAADGDMLLVNLSAGFQEKILRYGREREALLCYSMVNTLCINTGMKRVCFFFENGQVENIAGDIYWSGEFMYNPGL